MYYPKSQITTNLYSNGNFILKSTNKVYIGFYWKTSSGKYYTGKTPQDLIIEELILPSTDITSTDNIESASSISSIVYQTLIKTPSSGKIPIHSATFPTSIDYNIGEFTRYFCKKTNEIIYIEINQDTYNKLINRDNSYLWQMYTPIKYQWIIKGNQEKVYISNKNTTTYMMVNFKLPMLDKFLKEDYLKFWKP